MLRASSFTASLGFHASLLAAFMLFVPQMDESPFEDMSLPVDIITIDEFTQIMTGEQPSPAEKSTKQEAQQAVLETAPVAPPEPAENMMPVPDAVPENLPEVAPDDMPAEAPAPQAFKVANPMPRVRPSPPSKTSTFLDISRVQQLLNKIPEAAQAEIAEDSDAQTQEAFGQLTLNETDGFKAQVGRCWSPPSGARDAERLMVKIRVGLARDGRISGGPLVVNRQHLADPYFRSAAEAVLRAINGCQPYEMPPAKYRLWKDMQLTFDPLQMLGG